MPRRVGTRNWGLEGRSGDDPGKKKQAPRGGVVRVGGGTRNRYRDGTFTVTESGVLADYHRRNHSGVKRVDEETRRRVGLPLKGPTATPFEGTKRDFWVESRF